MAYRILQQNPQGISSRKALGVEMPFDSDSVFVPTYNTLEAYKVNLYNFFMTGRGERFLNPGLGSSLLQYLFEPIPDQYVLQNIQKNIQSEVETFFPRLEVTQVDVKDLPEYNSTQVSVFFKIRGTESEDKLVLDINR